MRRLEIIEVGLVIENISNGKRVRFTYAKGFVLCSSVTLDPIEEFHLEPDAYSIFPNSDAYLLITLQIYSETRNFEVHFGYKQILASRSLRKNAVRNRIPIRIPHAGAFLFCISSNVCIRYGNFNHSPNVYTVQVVNEFPHDPKALTQGLLYAENDTLFESTGFYGHSSVRRVALKTGKVEAIHNMDSSYFGEGLTLLGESLRHQMKDGWGLATDGKVLFGSDGTSTLYQIDPPDIESMG
ncbi:glutaminyl-peptide cyclotransferase [Melia azedarach]|uniref:Glutaminyl-peptide cyclotransferase n=1 Tax=Melia azedarach TaxID=155640 RepID=A0ACC1X5N1_MELAZ|nr:glutaminyl-peptide cyclotransferase [Melia azedarach]